MHLNSRFDTLSSQRSFQQHGCEGSDLTGVAVETIGDVPETEDTQRLN